MEAQKGEVLGGPPTPPRSGRARQSQSQELDSGPQTPDSDFMVSEGGCWSESGLAGAGPEALRGDGIERPLFSLRSASRATCDLWKESGDVSDSGSSTTSGHWSASSGISTPSPPHPQASPKYLGDAFGSPQTDNGFETDPDAFLLDEPAPRKRKVCGRVGCRHQFGAGRGGAESPQALRVLRPHRISVSLCSYVPS